LRRVAGVALGLAAAIFVVSSVRSEDLKAPPIPIAVADFDYFDTSGEPTNQQAEHQARCRRSPARFGPTSRRTRATGL